MRLIVALMACAVAAPALALTEPTPGKQDPRMTTAVYDPSQVYAVHVPQGQTFAILLGAGETATDGFGGDQQLLRADPNGNSVMLWSGEKPVTPRSIFVRSRLSDGTTTRTYSFLVDTRPLDQAAISLSFVYPADEAAKRAAGWRVAQANKEQKAAEAVLKASRGEADTNFSYVLQGETASDWGLLPTRQVSDNGAETHFWLPQTRMPVIYAENPDGKEAVVDYTFNSQTGIAAVHQLARIFHLRDGDSILCIYNKAFDAVGGRSTTGTISKDVERVAK